MPTYHILESLASWQGLLAVADSLGERDELLIDWSGLNAIPQNRRHLVLHLRDSIVQRGINCTHSMESSCVEQFYQIWDCPLHGRLDGVNEGMYISPIEGEEHLVADKERLMNYVKVRFDIGGKDDSPLGLLIAETYMNVCQHSGSERGYIVLLPPEENGLLRFFVSDVGVGIASSIKEYFDTTEFEDDTEAIAYALQDRVTRQSTLQNAGRGLGNIVKAVRGLNGSISIFANSGCIETSQQEPILQKIRLDFAHKGTFMEICINLAELDPLDDDDFSYHVHF